MAALDKESEFADRAIHEWTAQVFRDEDAAILGAQYRDMIRTERTKARERKKYDAVQLATWTPETLAEIDAAYAGDTNRPTACEPRSTVGSCAWCRTARPSATA